MDKNLICCHRYVVEFNFVYCVILKISQMKQLFNKDFIVVLHFKIRIRFFTFRSYIQLAKFGSYSLTCILHSCH
jgi:hypothetical protein